MLPLVRRLSLTWLFSLLIAAPILGDEHKSGAEGEHYAFLVGCGDYSKKEFRPLHYATADVLELQRALLDAGMLQENIVLLHDQRTERRYLPEGRKIREELSLLLGELQTKDTLIVALAGHGVQFRGEKQAYFCPVDGRISDRGTLIALDEIYRELERCRARRKILLIDACRNDPLSDVSRGSADIESITRPQALAVPQGIAVLHSCSPGQHSYEDDGLKHGVFFHHVLQGFRGAADLDQNKELSLDELATYVTRETQKYVRLNLAAPQIPQRKGETSGEWILRHLDEPIEHHHVTDCVPNGSAFVFAINVEQILNSPHAQNYLGALAKAPRLVSKCHALLRATGLNPLEDIVSIIVASPPAVQGEFNRMAITFHGRFQPTRVEEGWRRAGYKVQRFSDGKGGFLQIFGTNVGGVPAFLTVANRSTIIVTMQQQLTLEILLKETGHRETDLRNKHLELLVEKRYDPKASVWMLAMGTAYKVQGRTLQDHGIRYFMGSFHLGEQVDYKVVFSTDSSAIAKAQADPAEWRRLLTVLVGNQPEVAAPIIRGCTLFLDKSYLHVRGNVAVDVLMQWFQGA